MKFKLGKNGGKAEFFLSDEKGLCITVDENGEKYVLKIDDGVWIDRRYFDFGSYQRPQRYCKAFYEAADAKINGNIFEVSSNPLNVNTDEYVDDILITNRFTVCEDCSSIIQETFYTLNKKRYDVCHQVGNVDVSENNFQTAGNDEEGIASEIKEIPNNMAYQKEMVLKGENNKCMRVKGGFVSLGNGVVNAHTYFDHCNDDLSYFDKDNPIVTIYSFGDEKAKDFPKSNKEDIFEPELMNINAGTNVVSLVCKEDSVALWDEGKERSLVAMLLRNVTTGEEEFIDTLSLWEKVDIIQEGNTKKLILKNPQQGAIKDITLIIHIECIDTENRIEWSVEVENNSPVYSLLWCTYPRLYVSEKKYMDLFVPEFGGSVKKKFNQTDNYDGGVYPSGFTYPMQYYALYDAEETQDNGYYYAIHDNSGALKELYVASSQNGNVRFNCRYHAEKCGKAANSNKLPGKVMWQKFSGDWYDATEIYRRFVHTECDWYLNAKNKKTPEWMTDIPFWIMDWVPYDPESGEILPTNLRNDSDVPDIDDWYKNPIKLREEFGVPIGYHVYNWHQIPFNNDYPHFMPAKKRFVEAMPKLKENDIRVMPYINALLWDNQDRGDENFEFEEFGEPGAVKSESGKKSIYFYESKKKNGERVELSPMCPSYQLWRDKLTSLVTEMFEELGVDAIYLDQVAARMPQLCMDETHSHPTGGGSWWQKEYRELLAQLNGAKPKDRAFTTESNAEVYNADIDGFLSWMWTGSINDVPAFMRIYGGSVCVLGRSTNGATKQNDLFWKYHLAQAFVCGQQMGWINSDFVNNKARTAFAKKLVLFRYNNREFFKSSAPMRPPVVEAPEEHCFTSRLAMYHQGFMKSPYICGGILTDGNKKMLILVNISDHELTDVVSWNDEEYALSGSRFDLSGDGNIEMLDKNKMKCSIKGESFICIEW